MRDRILTAVVYPFYFLGLVAGGAVWLILLIGAAMAEGFKDGKRR